MISYLAFYILFIYEHYIVEDFDDLNQIGKFFIKPAYYIKSLLIYILSFILFPIILAQIFLKYNKKWLIFKENTSKRIELTISKFVDKIF